MPKRSNWSKQKLPTDKVLSVRQPEATLLVKSGKDGPLIPIKWIENRTWEPPLSPDQFHWILIHASAARCDLNVARAVYGVENCHFGAIIGYARLIGWKRFVPERTSDPCSDANNLIFEKHCKALKDMVQHQAGIRPRHGIYDAEQKRNMVHWIFTDPVMLDRPIYCRGRLRIWRIPKNQT